MKNVRKIHRWLAILVAPPLSVILLSGVLLQSRFFNPWMQPKYESSSRGGVLLNFPDLLEIAKAQDRAGIRSWDDVSQVDVRPQEGEIRVRSKLDHWEIVVDSASGKVLGVGQRRIGWMLSIHQGSLFGDSVRYGLFLPAALGAFFLLLTGLYLLLRPAFHRLFLENKMKSEQAHALV